jgi:hypothetical protein
MQFESSVPFHRLLLGSNNTSLLLITQKADKTSLKQKKKKKKRSSQIRNNCKCRSTHLPTSSFVASIEQPNETDRQQRLLKKTKQ